jgi:hypothetical protein
LAGEYASNMRAVSVRVLEWLAGAIVRLREIAMLHRTFETSPGD